MHFDYRDGLSSTAAPLHEGYWQPVDDWTLLPGSEVEIYERDRSIDTGTVEAVTVGGSILWLRQDGAVLRRIVEKIPGRHVRVIPTDG